MFIVDQREPVFVKWDVTMLADGEFWRRPPMIMRSRFNDG